MKLIQVRDKDVRMDVGHQGWNMQFAFVQITPYTFSGARSQIKGEDAMYVNGAMAWRCTEK